MKNLNIWMKENTFKLFIFKLLVVALFLPQAAHTQISQGGMPYSYTHPGILPEPVFEIMPEINLETLMAEDLIFDQIKSIPWRFGENIPVDLNPQNAGQWTEIDELGRFWRCGISCPGALSVNIAFDDFQLPPGASLYIYSDDYSDLIGSFTEYNNNESRIFATTLLKSDSIVLEYFEPFDAQFSGKLHLGRVTHGYRDAFSYAKNFGSSGSCNNNVNCPEAVGWENQIRSSCMLVVGGSGFCSGALVNNTSNDGTPYVLTANHCSSSNDFASWVFWFNWESPNCTNPSSSPAYNSVSGSTLKARNAGSDFCLVQMNSAPPSNYNVYYSGWDNSDTQPTRQVCIHHPDGDIKKISFDNNPATAVSWSSASCWQIAVWEDGTTEPGSSGSPLYDQNKRIIGQLFGGTASCTSLTSDNFGRFGISWNTGTSSATRLKEWLDPTNTGAVTLDGLDMTIPVPPLADFNFDQGSGCTGNVIFDDNSSGSPTSWLWDFGDGTNSTQSNPTHIYTSNGLYSVSLIVSNSLGSDTLELLDTISINMPVSPVTTSDSTCYPTAFNLNASGLGALQWFDTQTGGNLLITGNSYQTPVLTQSQTFWVEDKITNASQNVGKTDNSGTGGFYNNTTSHYLRFDVLSPCRLISVKVYAGATGNRAISLRNSSGAIIYTDTFNIPAGESRINLNYDLEPGTGYRLQAPVSPNLYRNSAGATFPYTINGIISIVGSSSSTAGTYYFFYDWEVANYCISPRTPLHVTIGSSELHFLAGDTIESCEGETLEILTVQADTYLWSNFSTNASVILTPTNGSQISVMLEKDGCVGNDTVHFVVHPYPIASAGSDTSICSGSSMQLTASGGTLYLWNTGSNSSTITINPLESTEYIVTVTDNNCSSTDQVIVSVNPLPVPHLGNDTIICANYGPHPLNPGSGFTSYYWSTSESTEQIYVSGDYGQNVNYFVTVTNAFGCESFDQIQIQFILCAGNENESALNDIQVYPQPFSESVNIVFPENEKLSGLSLYDAFGRKISILNPEMENRTIKLNLSKLPLGIYFLKLNFSNRISTIKLVRE